MATLTQLQTEIQTQLSISAASTFFTPTMLTASINAGQDWLAAQYNFPMLERSASIYTIAGTEEYAYPVPWSEVFKTDGFTRIEMNDWNDDDATYLGVWNATTNIPALASGVGSEGSYYVCTTAGSTTLDNVSSWIVWDIVYFDGTEWIKPEYTMEEYPKYLFEAYMSYREEHWLDTDTSNLRRMVTDRNRSIMIFPIPINTGLKITCYGTVAPTDLSAAWDKTFCDTAEPELDQIIAHKALSDCYKKAWMFTYAQNEDAEGQEKLNAFVGKLKRKQQRYRAGKSYFTNIDYFNMGSSFDNNNFNNL